MKSHVRGKEREKSFTDIHVLLCYSDNTTIYSSSKTKRALSVTKDKTGPKLIPDVLETEL